MPGYYNIWTRLHPGDDPEPKGERHTLPKALVRKLARESREGGRNCCHYCKLSFTTTYGSWYQVGRWRELVWVCSDCIDEHDLRRAAP